jgi:DNA (cytosine-5)-methyltransferase 1
MQSFNDQANPPPSLPLIIDNFAGGGGASTGIEMALGRSPNFAINHDEEALAMHAANHPETVHLCESVWDVDIAETVAGRHVQLAWFSPDCKHFSKAKGSKPVEKNIRGLAWIVLKWAGLAKPDVIVLENVEEFQTWGPLVDNQPCPRRKGMTFKRWITQLRNLGYQVDFRELRACDYGAPTIRKRLFVIARRDGRKIVWPEPTHGPKGNLFLQPYRTAAECIDWSIPCPSIFGRKRPLAEATLRRIARGIQRFVIDAKAPFIVNMAHGGKLEAMDEPLSTVATEKGGCRALVTPYISRVAHGEIDKNGKKRGKGEHSADEPLPTITASPEFAIITPFLAGVGGRAGCSPERPMDKPYQTITSKADAALIVPTLIQMGYGERDGQAPRVPGIDKPLGTLVGTGKHALVAAFLAGAGGPEYSGKPRDIEQPIHTQTTENHTALFTSHLLHLKGTCKDGVPVDQPMPTIKAEGTHIGEVRAFLIAYYGNEKEANGLDEPMRTVTSKDRLGLVTIHGEPYQIVDIGMRMLSPRELFLAQGFPKDFVIDPIFKGKPMTKTAQVRMCGNSVCPPIAEAIVRAQFGAKALRRAA